MATIDWKKTEPGYSSKKKATDLNVIPTEFF